MYLFRGKDDRILYIGKAKVLRDRVRSYFHKSDPQSPKLISLVSRVRDVEWLVTGSEVEALLTEANLVKEHAPKYNVSLKDDKSFPYIRITREPYPQVLLTRKIVKDGSKYFGPYTEVKALRETLKVIHKVFPIRSCSYLIDDEVVQRKKISVCLDYHIKKCGGPCEGMVSREEYNRMIDSVIGFLHGRTDPIVRDLRARMEVASGEMRYEEAALYRDQVEALQAFSERQRKVPATFADEDIIAVEREENDACAVLIRLRHGRIVGREKVYLTGVGGEDMEQIISDFMRQFYLDTDSVPAEIVVPILPADAESLAAWLEGKRGKRLVLKVPRRGEKARLLRMSRQNANLLLNEYRRRKERRRELVPAAVEHLQTDLRLPLPPRRIEAFDISNIQGTHPVGAMVCFQDGVARKGERRRFRIKSVEGIDDFAMMREVIMRRYRRLKSERAILPDLILVDGGKGQLGMAVSALQELGLTYISVAGLAKRLEEVFLPGYPEPQSIPKTSAGLLLLRRIRDEAHRVAVMFHRQRRREA
ncbi:MAG: excinuclease ABC subunit UvrC, partial [Fidelibacterota bacterium]